MAKVFAQYANVGDFHLETRYGKNGWEWSVRNRRKDSQAIGKANSLEHAKACAEEVAGGTSTAIVTLPIAGNYRRRHISASLFWTVTARRPRRMDSETQERRVLIGNWPVGDQSGLAVHQLCLTEQGEMIQPCWNNLRGRREDSHLKFGHSDSTAVLN
jgi:hypothetical protein